MPEAVGDRLLSGGFLILHPKDASQSTSPSPYTWKSLLAFSVREKVYEGNKATYSTASEIETDT